MDITHLLKIGARAFINSIKSGAAGSELDVGTLIAAFSNLLGAGGGNEIDLGSLMAKINASGLGDLVNSWLSDGANQPVSTDQIADMFGSDKIAEFAAQLGLAWQEAAGGLTDAIPQMVDQANSGGDLLGAMGGLSGVLGMAGKLFEK